MASKLAEVASSPADYERFGLSRTSICGVGGRRFEKIAGPSCCGIRSRGSSTSRTSRAVERFARDWLGPVLELGTASKRQRHLPCTAIL
jgi:hypothetical protein